MTTASLWTHCSTDRLQPGELDSVIASCVCWEGGGGGRGAFHVPAPLCFIHTSLFRSNLTIRGGIVLSSFFFLVLLFVVVFQVFCLFCFYIFILLLLLFFWVLVFVVFTFLFCCYCCCSNLHLSTCYPCGTCCRCEDGDGSTQRLVFSFINAYRNQYCALCNHYNLSSLSCDPLSFETSVFSSRWPV